jgi:hypothetical protein
MPRDGDRSTSCYLGKLEVKVYGEQQQLNVRFETYLLCNSLGQQK